MNTVVQDVSLDGLLRVSGSDWYAQAGRIHPFGVLASAVRTMAERWRRAAKFPVRERG